MKKLTLILILTCSLILTGCNKDAQVSAFMKEYDSVIDEVSEKLTENGFEEARKVFDDRKVVLRDKWQAISTARSFQVSEQSQKKMNVEPEKHIEKLVEAANKAIKKNPADEAAIKDLVTDIANTVRR